MKSRKVDVGFAMVKNHPQGGALWLAGFARNHHPIEPIYSSKWS
jgi:hypothetical protein